jgi:ABC-type sugar transport system ATPase subunit
VPTLDITENVWLNREKLSPRPPWKWLHRMDKRAMRREVEEGFERLGLRLPALRTKAAALSGGQRQAVAIARAVLWGSHIVVLDEPTAALGVHQTEIVLSFVERLKSLGVSVVLITHNMEHVTRVCDRVVVLRLGRKVADRQISEVDKMTLVAMMTGAYGGEQAQPADMQEVAS